MKEIRYIELEDIEKLNLKNVYLFSKLIEFYGHKIQLQLYEDSIKTENLKYSDYEDLSELISFITKKDVKPSELMMTEDENLDYILKYANALKRDYKYFEKYYKLSKETLETISNEFDKNIPLLKLPTYYMSFPFIFQHILIYGTDIFGPKDEEGKQILMSKVGLINLSGGKDRIPLKVFETIFNELDKIIEKHVYGRN